MSKTCENCKHWAYEFTVDNVKFGTCQNNDLLENIMVGQSDTDPANEWSILGNQRKHAPVWVEFFPRSTFSCSFCEVDNG